MTDLPTPRRDNGRILLIVVLALSLLLNALALGAAIRLHNLREAFGGGAAALTLPPDMRRDLMQALARDPDLRADLARVRAARTAAVAAATAKPFDRPAAEAAMTTLRTEVGTLMEQAQKVILHDLTNTAAQP
jgi:hypothetical protein